ncbi:MAG: DUF924 domain-containing protein [Myxococcota bacterium]|nr:DUF924 domain-containing protein [Myxococcota bacterium]
MLTGPEDVLSFWFGEPARDAATLGAKFKRWFTGGPDLDREIGGRFGAAVAAALEGKLDAWAETIRGRLALIILLDQFTRNIFRDDPRGFSGDGRAQRLAVDALDAGLERQLGFDERIFLMTPLGHAEDEQLQERSVAEAERLVTEATEWQRSVFARGIEQTRKYREVVARFGRFPHRNTILGRASTPEEEAFLVGWKERQRPSTLKAGVTS